VGGKVPAGVDGKSLLPALRGNQAGVRDTVFLAYKDVQRAVRQGDWKRIRYPKVNVTQLFNLRENPHELKNLADAPAQQEKVRALMTLLAQQQQLYRDTAPLTVQSPQPAQVDEAFFRGKKGKMNPKD